MEDTFLSFGGEVYGVKLSGEYHWFDSDHDFKTTGDGAAFSSFSGKHYGKELDLSAAYAYDKNWSGKVEYFSYNEDDCYMGTGSCANNVVNANRKRDKDNFLLTLMYTF
jgi:hypothetical protein